MPIPEEDARVARRSNGSSVSPEHAEAARALAEEVRNAPGADKAWPKITTVLDQFGEKSPTPEAGRRIDQAPVQVG